MTACRIFAVVLLLVGCGVIGTGAAPPAKPSGCKPLYGVAYDPFAFSEDSICLSKKQVAIDVEIMATMARSIRIYSLSVCPDTTTTLLAEARKHNMTVLLGVFIGQNVENNEEELDMFEDVMKKYSDVVQAVVVGNGALGGGKIGSKLRFAKRMSNTQLLVNFIVRVKTILRRNKLKHPVSTSEGWVVWESVNGFPLSEAIDFICLTINPYYEGFEVQCKPGARNKCTTASAYANAKAEGLAEYYGMDVWVCETGWPTAGEPCCKGLLAFQQKGKKAIPSLASASTYLSSFVDGADDRPYYISSAFDKDWRRIWSPCPHCAEKNLALSSFENGFCDLCEEEYQLGFFDRSRERKEGYKLPKVKCDLPSLPDVRLAGSEVAEATEPEVEKPKKKKKRTRKSRRGRRTPSGEPASSGGSAGGSRKKKQRTTDEDTSSSSTTTRSRRKRTVSE